MSNKKLMLIALAAAFAAPAMAQESGPKYTVSGFGTFGWAKDNGDKADFVRPLQPEASTSGLDTNLGLQLTGEFNKTISATVQFLARRSTRDEYKVKPEWAFVKAQLTPTMAVRVGRVAVPAFLISDVRNVGYANIAIRPQAEVYGQVSFSSIDGIDFTASTDVGSVNLTGNIGFGNVYTENTSAVMVDIKRVLTASVAAEFGPFTVRLAHVRTPSLSTVGVYGATTVINGLRATGFTKQANALDVNAKDADFTGLGVTMDYKNVLLQAEITERNTDSYVADLRGSYVTLGYRFNDLVPYVSFAESKLKSPRTDPSIPRAGAMLPLAMGVDALLAGPDQKSHAIGLRWNFAKSASLKVQADWVKPNFGSGYLVTRPGYNAERVRVVAAAVDYVF